MKTNTFLISVVFFLSLLAQAFAQPIYVGSGSDNYFLVCSDSNLLSWGGNTYGTLGDGSKTGFNATPTPVPSIGKIIMAEGHLFYAMAVTRNGDLYAWGRNQGQFGNNTKTESLSPLLIPNIKDVASVACGDAHALFLKKDGTVWGSGQSVFGQLADSNFNQTYLTPIQIKKIKKARGVASGTSYSLVLNEDSTVWSCGRGADGCLGLGDLKDQNVLTKITSLSRVVKIDALINTCVALDADGKVWVWGNAAAGFLGNGTDASGSNIPVQASIDNVIDIAAGGFHVYALKKDGTLWVWGNNPYGNFGNGTVTGSNLPVQISDLSNQVNSVTSSAGGGLAVKKDGSVLVWGLNTRGQVGTTEQISTKVPVLLKADINNCAWDVSVNTTDEFSFGLYPNPTSGMIRLNFKNTTTYPLNLELINLVGEVIYSNRVQSGVSEYSMDISSFSKGIYLLRAANTTIDFSRKIILE